jgi:hypothetical protein
MLSMLTETRERFLRAIIAQIPPDRIAEIHFFQSIKQGGVESGVAVVAGWPDAVVPPVVPPVVPVAAPEVLDAEPVADPAVDDESSDEESSDEESSDDAAAEAAVQETAEDVAELIPELIPEPIPEPVSDRGTRHVIYTARYRLTLKGLDRGKWETHVFAEADAPLVTIDAVVRGVQRRSGDVDDATRMDGDEVRLFAAAKLANTTHSAA